jgi:HSP20 family protein
MSEDTALQVQDTEKQEIEETGAERTRDRAAFVPRADIYETDDGLVVVLDMPGVDEGSVDITLEENVLTVNGYVDFEEPEGYGLAYAEYRIGDYVRAFTVSDEIDQEGVEATIKDGVLKLHLPKAPAAKKRQIPISVG